ncbi:type 4a pilus biogenesis protein PilO [Sulfuriferula sp.]|uniref:type 4a pilus biogenesis protein PilO n=1 Tax=Sulfuriferula sp. TaxID=2025307 RepID=UPI00272F5A65|nr:type 4a pilus biogenesis protein PilO [Sulfuriferula sp.]MDP2027413.1 type 4a pilus biogenesis protein PilO [Sulfuriferula sp.]
MTLDDINNINLKDLANAPMGAKAAILGVLFVALVFAGYWFVWSGQLDTLNTAKQEEMSLRDTYLNKKRQAVNLDLYKQQLKDIERSFGALLKQLPNKSEMDALLTDINQAGLGRGLQFELFKPGAETVTDFYAALPISVRVTGSYHDLGAFASDIALLPRIVTLHDVDITPDKDGGLAMNATIKTYRYLDDNELEAQKKDAKGAAKK